MWEITLFGDREDLDYFYILKDKLNKMKSSVYTAINLENNIAFSIACKEEGIEVIEYYIYECIISRAKAKYLRDNLEFSGKNEAFNNFIIDSIVLIDLKDEIEYARLSTSLSSVVYLQSFVTFKLYRLIEVWDRIVSNLNAHFSILPEETMYLEYLKFLADSAESRYDILYIDNSSIDIQILSKDSVKLKSIPSTDEIDLIISLIMYSPKKLIIKSNNKLSKKISNLIKYIFRDRVSLVL